MRRAVNSARWQSSHYVTDPVPEVRNRFCFALFWQARAFVGCFVCCFHLSALFSQKARL
jgi:hypothetical protein